MTNKISMKVALTLCLIFLLLLAPVAARAGVADIISLLTTITGTLNNSIGQVLDGIQTVNTDQKFRAAGGVADYPHR